MTTARNQPEFFPNAAREWNVERLRTDLSQVKGKSLSRVEQQDLNALLSGYSPTEIAQIVHVESSSVRTRLSKGLYRYIETLISSKTGHPTPVKDWGHLPRLLEHAGYRVAIPSAASIPTLLIPPSNHLDETNLDRTTAVSSALSVQDWWNRWGRVFVKRSHQRDWQEPYFIATELEQIGHALIRRMNRLLEQQDYNACKALWQDIEGFTHVYEAYWLPRLEILKQLRQLAKQHGDRPMLAKTLSEIAWTLTLLEQSAPPDTIKFLFEEAATVQPSDAAVDHLTLSTYQAVFHLSQDHIEDANRCLSRVNTLLKHASSNSPVFSRHQMNLFYYQGEIAFTDGDFNQAKTLYKKALKYAQKANWVRATVATQNWLTAIALQQGNLAEAQYFLDLTLPVAQSRQDKRCIAFCYKHYALLEQGKGNADWAAFWAQQAQHGFAELNMNTEVQPMATLAAQSK